MKDVLHFGGNVPPATAAVLLACGRCRSLSVRSANVVRPSELRPPRCLHLRTSAPTATDRPSAREAAVRFGVASGGAACPRLSVVPEPPCGLLASVRDPGSTSGSRPGAGALTTRLPRVPLCPGKGAMGYSPAPGGGFLRPGCRWAGSVKDRRRRHVCARRASLTGSARRMLRVGHRTGGVAATYTRSSAPRAETPSTPRRPHWERT